MNKRNYIKIFVIFITVTLSLFAFLSTRYEYSLVSGIIVPISLLFAIPIFMSYKYKDIEKKKFKTLYLIIMIILYILIAIFLSLFVLEILYPTAYIILEDGNKIPTGGIFQKVRELNTLFSPLLFMITSWLMLFINFNDLDKKDDKVEFYLTLAVSLIIILIHINFYINPNLRKDVNIMSIDEQATYITQNYIYFAIMYVALITKKFITKSFR